MAELELPSEDGSVFTVAMLRCRRRRLSGASCDQIDVAGHRPVAVHSNAAEPNDLGAHVDVDYRRTGDRSMAGGVQRWMTPHAAVRRFDNSAGTGTRYRMCAATIFCRVRINRLAIADSVVSRTAAIWDVDNPQSVRSANVTWASMARAGWQQLKIRRNWSSRATPSVIGDIEDVVARERFLGFGIGPVGGHHIAPACADHPGHRRGARMGAENWTNGAAVQRTLSRGGGVAVPTLALICATVPACAPSSSWMITHRFVR